MTTMKNILWFLCVCLLSSIDGLGQTEEDLRLSYKNELVEEVILECNDGEPPYRILLKNETPSDLFVDFKLRLGDEQSSEVSMANPGSSKSVEYKEKGSYTLQFVGVTSTGREVVRLYKLKIVGKPNAILKKQDQLVKCLNSEVKYMVEILSGDTEGTQYFLNYDDGSELDELNRSTLANGQGMFIHQYKESYCEMKNHDNKFFKVSLTYKNECSNESEELATVSEYVAVPFEAIYTFDRLGKGKVCTYEKINLRNITTGGTGSDCSNANAIAFWDFGNGETSEDWEPYIEYKDADNPYKIKLKVSNSYACATDSVEHPVDLINRVQAIMKPEKNRLCVGEELFIDNKSSGDGVTGKWTIVSLDGFPNPGYNGDTWDLRVKFTHWGKYRVTLFVENSCSKDQADTVITVIQDPNLTSLMCRGMVMRKKPSGQLPVQMV